MAAAIRTGRTCNTPNRSISPTRHQIEAWIREAKAGCVEARGRLLQACREVFAQAGRADGFGPVAGQVCALGPGAGDGARCALRFFPVSGRAIGGVVCLAAKDLVGQRGQRGRRYEESAKRQLSREISLDAAAGIASELRDNAPSPRSVLGRIEKQQRVERALERLPGDQKTAILLRSRDHCSFVEIGVQMQRSADAARKLWFRGIEQLRRELVTPDERDERRT